MQILLMCQHESGQVAFNAEFIEGLPVPQRRYDIRNYQVVLDGGFADVIVHHDADELLKNPLYRMPTPAEQEQMAGRPFKVGELQESASISTASQVEALVGDIVTGDIPASPPAVLKRKKAN